MRRKIFLLTVSAFVLMLALQGFDNRTVNEISFLPSDLVSHVKWSPNGTRLAVSTGFEVFVYDTETWEEISKVPEAYTYDISWNPDSTLIAGTRGGSTIGTVIWDSETGNPLHEFIFSPDVDIDGAIITRAAPWHPLENLIATDTIFCSDEAIMLWDVNLHEEIYTPFWLDVDSKGCFEPANVIWSDDGSRLLSSGLVDNTIQEGLWKGMWMPDAFTFILDIQTGDTIAQISGNAAIWGADNNTVATRNLVDDNGKMSIINIWDISTQSAVMSFNQHSDNVTAMAWNKGNPLITSADVDDNFFIWNLNTGIAYDIPPIEITAIRSLDWKPNSNVLAIGGREGVQITEYNLHESIIAQIIRRFRQATSHD